MSPVVSLQEVKDFQSRLNLSRQEAIRFYQWIASLQQAKSTHGALYHTRVVHKSQRASIIAVAGIVRDADGTYYWGCVACEHRKAKLVKDVPLPPNYKMWQPPSRDIPRKLQLHKPTLVLCPRCIITLPQKGLYSTVGAEAPHVDDRLAPEEAVQVTGETGIETRNL